MQIYTIGIAEQKIVKAPDKLVTLGLGSCIGLVLYDPVAKIGGMVHIMLPCAPKNAPVTNKSKFADTAIAELIRLMVAASASRTRLTAKIAGGAHMFHNACNTDILNIGARNVQMCKQVLRENIINIAAEDTGGNCGRSIEFCCESNVLQVRTVVPRCVRLL
jgi:Chemotaxis protein; stimulates methylation of MCP proteins